MDKQLVLVGPSTDELETLKALYVQMTGKEPTAQELKEAKAMLASQETLKFKG